MEPETFCRPLLDNMEEGVYLYDHLGKILYTNPAFHRITGISTKEAVGRDHLELFEEQHATIHPETIVKLRQQNISFRAKMIALPEQESSSSTLVVLLGRYRHMEDAQAHPLEVNVKMLDGLFSTSPDLVAICDSSLRYIYVSSPVSRILGLDRKDILGKTWRELNLPPEPMGGVEEQIKEVFETGRIFVDEASYSTTKGGRSDWEYILTPIHSRHGVVEGVMATARNITDRIRAEEALLLDEARLEALQKLNHMTEASSEELISFALDAGVKLTGSKFGYLAFLNHDETVLTIHSWSSQAMKECAISNPPRIYPVEKTGLWGEAVRQRKAIITNDYKASNPYKKGIPEGHVIIDCHMNVPVFEGEKIVLLAGVGNKKEPYNDADVRQLNLMMSGMWRLLQRRRWLDELQQAYDLLEKRVEERTAELAIVNLDLKKEITEHLETERHLKAAHQRLSDTIDFLPDATFAIDTHGKVTAWNRSMEEMTGVAKENMIGKGDYAYAIPFYGHPKPILIDLVLRPNPELEAKYHQFERAGSTVYAETLVPFPNQGSERYLWGKASALLDGEGNIVGAIESVRDVTDRKRAEEQLRKRDALLSGVAVAANILLAVKDYESAVNQSLEILGLAAEVDRVHIFENHEDPPGKELLFSHRFEWSRDGVTPHSHNQMLMDLPYNRSFPRWPSTLARGEVIGGLVREFPLSERKILESMGIRSILLVPIIIHGKFWGFIGFEDCRTERIWNHGEVSILRASAGSIGAAVLRKRWEKDLLDSEERFRTIFEAAQDCIFIKDTFGRYVHANPAVSGLLGRGLEDIVGKTDREFFGIEAGEHIEEMDARVLKGEIVNEEHTKPINDKPITTHVVKVPMRDSSGRIVGICGFARDVTQRKKTEEALIEARNYLESLINYANAPILVWDPSFKITRFNRACERLTGYMAEEVIGKDLFMLFPQGEISPEVQRTLQGERMDSVEIPILRKNGEVRVILWNSANIYSSDGWTLVATIAQGTDITDRKIAEVELLKAKEASEAAARTKSEFLANMSHEIRTPMNAVIGMTSLLLNTPLTKEQQEYLEMIRRSGDSLLKIINDILDFSKIEGGKLELETQPFDLRECIEISTDLVLPGATKKGLALSYSLDQGVPATVLGDVTRLRQVLVNLLDNAVKFTTAGHVHITVTPERTNAHDMLHFSVEDTGIGISPEGMDRLFQSFSQADPSTTRKYGGTGLGLAICKRLVELMGGEIWAESIPGKGSTFHFTITSQPYFGTQIKAGSKLEGKKTDWFGDGDLAVPKEKRLGTPQSMDILLAEDNVVNQKVALMMLEKLGYRADVAASGLEVLLSLERQEYDLVLMDIQMPEMDGLETARQIRNRWPKTGPAIVAMTAYAMEGDEDRCLAAGMDAYVSKPVKLEELKETLNKVWLRRGLVKKKNHPSIDQKALLRLRELQEEGEPDIVKELGQLFLTHTPSRISKMKEGLEGEDLEVLQREAHSLKSSSANLGATKLFRICSELELLARKGERRSLAKYVALIEAEFERVKAELEGEMGRNSLSLQGQVG